MGDVFERYNKIEDIHRRLFVAELSEDLLRRRYKYEADEMVALLIRILDIERYTPSEMKEIFQRGVDFTNDVLNKD